MPTITSSHLPTDWKVEVMAGAEAAVLEQEVEYQEARQKKPGSPAG